MTEVEVPTGVADPTAFACRLLRKAHRQGVRVLVTAPPETLAALDRALWVTEERDFLPHVRMPGAASAVAARTPIWLASRAGLDGAPRVCVNIGADVLEDLDALDRLIEIVTVDPDDAAAGRARWRRYKARGLNIVHHAATGNG